MLPLFGNRDFRAHGVGFDLSLIGHCLARNLLAVGRGSAISDPLQQVPWFWIGICCKD